MPDWLHCKHFALLFVKSESSLCVQNIALCQGADIRCFFLFVFLFTPYGRADDFSWEWEEIDGKHIRMRGKLGWVRAHPDRPLERGQDVWFPTDPCPLIAPHEGVQSLMLTSGSLR